MNRVQWAAKNAKKHCDAKKHAKARVWYSISCPACGKDTYGAADGNYIGIRIAKGQKKFRCRCGAQIDLRNTYGSLSN